MNNQYEMINDQTSYPTKGELAEKNVLVIGSGSDLDGRKMKELIDSDTYDIIARVNKYYGNPDDVGTRTDYIFTRWQQWLSNADWFSQEQLDNAKEIIILNQHAALKHYDSYAASEYQWLCAKVGHEHVSAGAQAIDFFLNRGVKQLDVIGFGCKGGKFLKDKIYTKGSDKTTPEHNTTKEGKDMNELYDWHKERQWEINQARVNFL